MNTAEILDALKLFVAVVEGLRDEINDKLPELKEALDRAEKLHEQLAADRAEADTELDKKFDGGGTP